ncbi:hypothetical protein ACFYYS_18395 [Streptomyces sp. NPDC002120]|uniref:hypothetical protein n=1 Tax=Streptomyces sp. NPDC002120 TaxID=3364631 RepID=UPI00369B0C7D
MATAVLGPAHTYVQEAFFTPTINVERKALAESANLERAPRAACPPADAPAPPITPDPPKPKKDLSHTWVVAAEVPVAPRVASIADFRGSFKATEGMRIDALEVYCKGCRRLYDEVKGSDCDAKVDNQHLIGGDQTKRAKRNIPKPPPPSAKIIPGGRIDRRGISAYMSGVARPR